MTARRKTRPSAPKAHRRRRAPVRHRRPAAIPVKVNRQPGSAESGLAPGMQAVNAYLAVANVAASVEFLERAFGFARGVVLPDADGQLRYAEMSHGESVLMLIRKG